VEICRRNEKKDRIVDIMEHYDAPTVDVYFELKVCQVGPSHELFVE
jgi:hypothetical protein